MVEEFSQLKLPLRWAEGPTSNLEPRDNVRITEVAPIVRRVGDHAELSMVKWSWAGPGGKPVFNFRSDVQTQPGEPARLRDFSSSDRVLIPADGFYEFTKPADPKAKRKDKWLFTMAGVPWFWIAGVVKNGAFAMLTAPPGPDVAPYHDRQVVVLPPGAALDWLDLARPQSEVLRALPAGALRVVQAA